MSAKKVIFLGPSMAGKTSLLFRLTNGQFMDEMAPTYGAGFKTMNLPYDDEGHSVKVHLWDTAGQERYQSMNRTYYRNTNCAIIVFDINNRESFEKAKNYEQDLVEEAGAGICKFLVANKCDMPSTSDSVTYSEGAAYA